MKKRDVERGISILLWILMVLLAGYIIVKGLALEKKDMEYMMGNIQHQALKIYLPGITETEGEKDGKQYISVDILYFGDYDYTETVEFSRIDDRWIITGEIKE